MFSTTFLGHQGWMFATAATRILLDPVLVDEFGYRGMVGSAWPPRDIRFQQCPRPEAVVITHEHEDHFNLPTLNQLDRSIPIYLSSSSSVAARTILCELGFEVIPLPAGAKVTIGDLELHTFAADHVNNNLADEWDVRPFLIRDTSGHGSLFSTVDGAVRDDIERVREIVEVPGLWCYTNNIQDYSFLDGGKVDHPKAHGGMLLANMASKHEQLASSWVPPVASVVCGGGWSFSRQPELDRHVFICSSERACKAMSTIYPSHRFHAVMAGQTLAMSDGRLIESEPCSWISVVERERWPNREYVPFEGILETFEPACGVTDLSDADGVELLSELNGFARYLYGRDIFMQLHSVSTQQCGARRPALAIVLLADANRGSYVAEYRPEECRFVLVDSDEPTEEFVAGIELWATDLLAGFRGELTPMAFCAGRVRSWSAVKEVYGWHVPFHVWLYLHPLYNPERALASYRRVVEGLSRPHTRLQAR